MCSTVVQGMSATSPILRIEGDLACYSDALRTHGDGWRSELVLLSMFGPRNAVRAAWATLSSSYGRKGYRKSIKVGTSNVSLHESVTYSTVQVPLERGLLHCVIFHPMLGHNAPDLGYFFQVGPGADQRYFDRLARWCQVPLRATWRVPLWSIGCERGAIVELKGHGRDVWHVSTSADIWGPIVRDALLTGDLT